jgi:hypothetical protein
MNDKNVSPEIIMHCLVTDDAPSELIPYMLALMALYQGPVHYRFHDRVFSTGLENLHDWAKSFRETEKISRDDAVVIFTGTTPPTGKSLNWDPRNGRNFIISTEGKLDQGLPDKIFQIASDLVMANLIQAGLKSIDHGIQAGLTYDGVRKRMLAWDQSRKSPECLPMEIKVPLSQIRFPEMEQIFIHLTTYEQAIYLFFLKHSEGINIRSLNKHINEIYEIAETCEESGIFPDMIDFDEFSKLDFEVPIRSINDQIRFVTGDNLADYYMIRQDQSGNSGIAMDRSLLTIINDFK